VFCECPFALHDEQPEKDKQNVDFAPPGKIPVTSVVQMSHCKFQEIVLCGKVTQMHTIHESNCIVTKLPHNRNTKMKRKLTVYRSYQAQLMGRMHLMIFIQMIHL